MKLTEGAIEAISTNSVKTNHAFEMPVLQVVTIKKLEMTTNAGQQERYRLVISDSKHVMSAMIATQLNHYCTSNKLTKNGIIRIKNFVTNNVNNKQILIIIDMELLTPSDETVPRIGDPRPFEAADQAQTDESRQQQQQQQMPQKPVAPYVAVPSVANQPSAPISRPQPMNPPSYAEPMQPMQQNRSIPVTSSSNGTPIKPISILNPYENKWTICARVVSKSDIREWHKEKSSGRLFSVTLADESGEIKATGFNDQVDHFYHLLQDNQVYFISNASIKMTRRQYSNVNNDYEMNLEKETQITPCTDLSVAPQIKYNRVPLSELVNIEKDTSVDVIAVVHEVGELGEIVTKTTNKVLKKKEITIADETGYQVRVTLWGKTAETFHPTDAPVVALKGCKVNDYGGRSLSLTAGGTITVNPDVKEAHVAKGWYENTVRNGNAHLNTFVSEPRTPGASNQKKNDFKWIAQVKEENLGMGDKPDYFTVHGMIAPYKKDALMYTACPGEDCNKKLTNNGDSWRCEKCDRSWPNPIYRYIASFHIIDHTDQLWVQAFNETTEVILGHNANELHVMQTANQSMFEDVYTDSLYKDGIFKIRAKNEVYKDESRVRYSLMNYQPMNYATATFEVAHLIEQYLQN